MAIAVEVKVLLLEPFRFEKGPEKGLLDMGLFKAKLTFFLTEISMIMHNNFMNNALEEWSTGIVEIPSFGP
jgi:hypothetical protein